MQKIKCTKCGNDETEILRRGKFAEDILFLAFISGASMNPARALAPALLSGTFSDLWLYWTAPFVGTIIVAFLFKGKFAKQRREEL